MTQTETVGAARGVRIEKCARPSTLAAPGSLLHVLELVEQLNPADTAVLTCLEPAAGGPVVGGGWCRTDSDGSVVSSVAILWK